MLIRSKTLPTAVRMRFQRARLLGIRSMKTHFRIFVASLISILVGGCATRSLDTTDFKLIDDFDSIEKSCSSHHQCKTLKVNYLSCGHYSYMVYSVKTIAGSVELDLKKIAKENIELGKRAEEESMSETCLAISQIPFQGVCWKNGCEMIQTWR